jgi:phosphohistidine phosphatase
MRRLMLLRHAKSDWSRPGLSDHDRPLNARGREAAPRVGAYMAHHKLVPDLVAASTARRVQETVKLALAAFAEPPRIVTDQRIYEAEPETLIEVIGGTPKAVRSLLLVGHNPGLEELAARLVMSGKAGDRARLAAKFPTAALAVIDFKTESWTRLGPGRLERFVVPRTLTGDAD